MTLLSYCVVNTGGRDYLLDCLAAIKRTHPEGVEHELLVLDNASQDGSADAVRELHPDVRLFALERREGKADNDSRLLAAARGRYCLLLNEDSELHEGATRALLDALEADPGAAAAGAQLLTSEGEPTACAWRLPDIPWALARRGVQPRPRCGSEHAATGCARWAGCSRAQCWCGAQLPSRSTGSTATSSSTRTRPTSAAACTTRAGASCSSRARSAVHHDQLGTDSAAMRRRIVEFHRNRDLYFRKHGMRVDPPRLEGLLDLGLSGSRRCRDGAAGPRPAALPAPREAGAPARAG